MALAQLDTVQNSNKQNCVDWTETLIEEFNSLIQAATRVNERLLRTNTVVCMRQTDLHRVSAGRSTRHAGRRASGTVARGSHTGSAHCNISQRDVACSVGRCRLVTGVANTDPLTVSPSHRPF